MVGFPGSGRPNAIMNRQHGRSVMGVYNGMAAGDLGAGLRYITSSAVCLTVVFCRLKMQFLSTTITQKTSGPGVKRKRRTDQMADMHDIYIHSMS